MPLWWLSFSDPTKTRGFLGVVITEADSITAALTKINLLKLNPGGEMVGVEVPTSRTYDKYLDRLIVRPEINEIGENTMKEPS